MPNDDAATAQSRVQRHEAEPTSDAAALHRIVVVGGGAGGLSNGPERN